MKAVLSKIILLLIVVPLVLLYACTPVEDVTPTGGTGKPVRQEAKLSLYHSVLDEDRTFSMDEDVIINLYVGTSIKSEEIVRKIGEEFYTKKTSIYAMRFDNSDPDLTLGITRDNEDELFEILGVNEFCKEVFPIIDVNNLKNPNRVVLPKELFVEESGVIVIGFEFMGYGIENRVYYKIEDNAIYLEKKASHYGEVEYEK